MKNKVLTSILLFSLLLIIFVASIFIFKTVDNNVRKFNEQKNKIEEFKKILPNYSFQLEEKIEIEELSVSSQKMIVVSGAYVIDRSGDKFGFICKVNVLRDDTKDATLFILYEKDDINVVKSNLDDEDLSSVIEEVKNVLISHIKSLAIDEKIKMKEEK